MKTVLFLFLSILLVVLSSCEERTGYLDDGQENTLSMLTGKEWLMVYSEPDLGYTQSYVDETSVYFFDLKGNGWTALTCLNDETVKKDVFNGLSRPRISLSFRQPVTQWMAIGLSKTHTDRTMGANNG